MYDTQQILDFLSALKYNNSKEWMDANREWYENARDEFRRLVSFVLERMKDYDSSLSMLEARNCIFRINRDIRFSTDKTPYKTWFSAVFAEGGKKSLSAVYYLHLQPEDESMGAAGLYQPAGEQLKKVRQEIDYNAQELKSIINSTAFVHHFGMIQGEKLIRAPKGYQPDHPNIEFLKLKSYLATRKYSDAEIHATTFSDQVIDTFRAAQPFNEFLNTAIS